MIPLDNIVITDIYPPMIVHSEKDRNFQMDNRPYFGLSLCKSGQITYTMNGKNYISNKNNAILLPQGKSYTLFGNKEGLFPVVNFKCQNFDCSEIVVFPLENTQTCLKEFEKLKDLFSHKENRLKIYSTFYELLSEVFFENSNAYNPLKKVMKYIEENISDVELSNIKLAQKLGISEVYLRKQFSAHLKNTPKQYILNIRIQKAKQMLLETPFTVTTIAKECGFGSVYHFCRAFKEKTGVTPTEYAKLNKIYSI